jgi:hypothetical protein
MLGRGGEADVLVLDGVANPHVVLGRQLGNDDRVAGVPKPVDGRGQFSQDHISGLGRFDLAQPQVRSQDLALYNVATQHNQT